jgi:hypothetical protein
VEGGFEGDLWTVEVTTDNEAIVKSYTTPPKGQETPSNFLEVLREWGCIWIWKDMKISNSTGEGVSAQLWDDGDWIRQAITDGSLMGATDGSYIRELCPQLSSAALILECQKGRG